MSSINSSENQTGVGTQLRKGMLSYCVLRVCALGPVYSSDILQNLQLAGLEASGGTVYPLLSRLKTDGLLSYRWRENKQGPPRKYFTITAAGETAMQAYKQEIDGMQAVVRKVEKLKPVIPAVQKQVRKPASKSPASAK